MIAVLGLTVFAQPAHAWFIRGGTPPPPVTNTPNPPEEPTPPVATPEPGSLLLMGTGLVGLLFRNKGAK